MPVFNTKIPRFKKGKTLDAEWTNFRKGLNLLLRPTELGRDEMAQADNILLKGSGVPTGRWGSSAYFTVNATGSIRGFATYKDGLNNVNEIMALSDEGYLAKKNGSGSTQITGQSWPSGTTIRAEQLGGKTYIVSEDVVFTEYDGTDLTAYATISPPTGLYATNFSGATGTNQVSWKIVAVGENGGTTTPSGNYVLTDLPFDLSKSQYHLFWSAPSAATLSGFEIYRGTPGDERFLAAVGSDVTTYVDSGDPTSQTIIAPITNTTGGVKSKFIKKYKDRLLIVPADDPNKLMISGRFPNQTKFSWADGGGFIYIDPDSGDDITGIAVQPIADRIVIYKNNSSYLVELTLVDIGNYAVLDPTYQPISTYVGCGNQGTIATVENDTFYFGTDGIYVTGYEPNFLNIIRTNEVSARIRPYFESLSMSDYETANAAYIDNKYLLSIPSRRELICYDRERGAFAGIWQLPFGISHMLRYFDETGAEKWVIGSSETNQVYTFERSVNSDNGTTILKTIRTGKEDFGDWTRLAILRFFYILFASITGETTVNLIVEDRAGNTSTVKSFTISGSEVAGKTGWGMNEWGSAQWGKSTGSYVASTNEITRWASIFKQSRLVQVEVTSTANASNFELLSIKMSASPQSEGSLSSAQRV